MMRHLIGTTALLAVLGSGAAEAQDTLQSIQHLYSSADYEGALGALTRLGDPNTPAVAVELEQVRALCLIALGREAEASEVVDRIFTLEPAFRPGDQMPPRVRAVFDQAQRRVLPRVARELYAQGKAAYDRQAYADAVRNLQAAMAAIGQLPEEDRSGLSDLRVLGDGFIELSRAAIAKAEAPPPPPAEPAAPEPTAPPPPPTEAVPLRQDMPPWNPMAAIGRLAAGFNGIIEVDIDEAGAVTAARIVDPSYPAYDVLLLEAAKSWRYAPARRNGEPVKSSRRVGVVLAPR